MLESLLLLFQAPSLALQVLIDGILVGAILALPAYGMALVWGVMNIINVAQGEFVILGGFVSYLLYAHFGLNPIASIPLSAAALFVLGWALYRIVIHRVVDRDLFVSLLATFGISILLQQVMNLIFTADIQGAESGLDSWVLLDGQLVVSQIKVIAFALAVALGVVLYAFLRWARLGQAIRATAQNARAARVMGVDADHVYAVTYGLNAAICGAAGALVVMTWVISPFLGILYTVRSFLIVVVAGLGNLAGVAAAGLGLGALENYAGFVLGAEFQVAFVYLLMVAILVWRSRRLRRVRRYLR